MQTEEKTPSNIKQLVQRVIGEKFVRRTHDGNKVRQDELTKQCLQLQ